MQFDNYDLMYYLIISITMLTVLIYQINRYLIKYNFYNYFNFFKN